MDDCKLLRIPLKKRTAILRITFFLAVVLVLNGLLTGLFQTKDKEEFSAEYYNFPRDTFDVVFAGPSVSMEGIYPMNLWDEYGIASYNLSCGNQSLACSYYLVKEAIRKDSPDVVVVDTFYCGYSDLYLDKDKVHMITDSMPFWSRTRAQMIRDLIPQEQRLEFWLPLDLFHSRWKDLKKQDFEAEDARLTLGAYIRARSVQAVPAEVKESDAELPENSRIYIEKIIRLCRENNVPLVLTMMPVQGQAAWFGSLDSQFRYASEIQEIADSNGVPYLDFLHDDSMLHLDPAKDTRDGIHLNIYGAAKMSSWMGQYLRTNYNVPDRRQDPKYQFLQTREAEYHRLFIQRSLESTNRLEYYLDLVHGEISSPDWLVVITTQNALPSGQITSAEQDTLEQIGIRADLTAGCSEYIAVLDGGELVHEETGHNEMSPIRYEGTVSGLPVEIVSQPDYATDPDSVRINDGEYAQGGHGLNIVVYDKKAGKLIDSVSFDFAREEPAEHVVKASIE